MKNLLSKSISFYKAAADYDLPRDPIKKKKKYDAELPVILSATNTDEIARFISNFYNEPYFDFDAVAKSYANIFYSIFPINELGRLFDNYISTLSYHYVDPAEQNKFMEFLANDILKNHPKYLITISYIEGFERYKQQRYISSEVLRQAQSMLIAKIIKEFKEGDELVAVSWLTYLIRHSKEFSRPFLERLAKHFGVDVYAEVMHRFHGSDTSHEVMQLKTKDQLTVYDVARVIRDYAGEAFTGQILQELIDKSDSNGHEYLRSILYRNRADRKIFMLDETMQPMNDKYKKVSMPKNIEIIYDKDLIPPKEQAKWTKIFSEFKLIQRTLI